MRPQRITSRLRWCSFASKRTTGSGLVGATFQRIAQHKGRYVRLSAMNALVPKPRPMFLPNTGRRLGAGGHFPVPAVIADAGEHAARRFLEFFAATIRNRNTRMAYYRAVCTFFSWLEQNQIGLVEVEPVHVAAYVERLLTTAAKPTVKQHLAAIRHLFDWLVVGQVLAV